MGIGQRKQLQLVQIVNTKGLNGEWNEAEGVRLGLWAEVTDPSGFRSYERGKTQLETVKSFKLRFRFDKYPGADWKIRYENKDWTITQILKLKEKKFYWDINAISKANV